MTGASLSFPRRLWPRRMRTRLAVFYAVLLVVVGAGLLAVTYTVTANFLVPAAAPLPSHLTPEQRSLLRLCKPPPTSRTLVARCDHLLGALGEGAKARGDTLAKLAIASAIAFGVLVIGAAALGWALAGRALRPLRSLTLAARRASELSLGERLALTGPDDELKELADTFDLMLERLDAAFNSQRRFVANAAHELRTPLTAMRTAIEVTLSKPVRTPEQLEAMALKVTRSVELAEKTVEALLTLATSEGGPTVREPVDLATAAEDALDAAQQEIAQRRLDVDAELERAPTVGDRVLLERMVANLVDNAVQHNTPAGTVHLRTGVADGRSFAQVTNSGVVIAADEVPVLFEPFRRLGQQRVGDSGRHGLGLSIVRAIANAHGGTVDAAPGPNGGLAVVVTFPREDVQRVQ